MSLLVCRDERAAILPVCRDRAFDVSEVERLESSLAAYRLPVYAA